MRIVEIISGAYAPLFHGTHLIALASIVSENALKEGAYWGRAHEPHGVRLTRSFRIAQTFTEHEVPAGGIIQFDQGKIRQRYRIVQYQDVDANGQQWNLNEMEEVVLAPAIPITGYATAIFADPAQITELRTQEWGEYAVEELGYQNEQEYFASLDQLARHPLLRPTKIG
jgi:hypothetical protein